MGDLVVNKTLPACPDGHITKWLTVLDMVGSAGALGEMLVVPLNLFSARDYGWQGMYRDMGSVL